MATEIQTWFPPVPIKYVKEWVRQRCSVKSGIFQLPTALPVRGCRILLCLNMRKGKDDRYPASIFPWFTLDDQMKNTHTRTSLSSV